jgi:GTPase
VRSPQAGLEEAIGLAAAIDLDIVGAELVRLVNPRPATLFGKGTVELLAERIAELEVTVCVVDAPVTPVQQRNLEKAWQCKVIDRTGLILEIFGARARTHEGRLQVELASLSYQRSRLVRSWTHLERQRGGFGFLGGPGESQLEIDRRLIGERITRLRRELQAVKQTRELHRNARRRVPYPIVALVGYTNAGKSTLFNRLTKADVFARDLLFATLDPTMRSLQLPSGRKAILSDTVGFISDLPTHLIAAFRATLEEVLEADLIVHVRDIAHPDTEAQAQDVMTVLKDLGVDPGPGETKMIEAFNKIDLLDDGSRERISVQAGWDEDVVPVSAVTGDGCDALLARIDRLLAAASHAVEIDLPLADGASIAWLYRHGEVLERHDDGETTHLVINMAQEDLARFHARQRAS